MLQWASAAFQSLDASAIEAGEGLECPPGPLTHCCMYFIMKKLRGQGVRARRRNNA
jgi:hypothetical protein